MRRSLVVLLVTASLSVVVSACDWSQIGWDSTQTNGNSSETAITPANVSTLHEHFTATFASGQPIQEEPLVSNGLMYTSANANPGSFYAFSASDASGCSGSPSACTPLWSASIGSSFQLGVIAVANGFVYGVGGGAYSSIYAFDASGQSNCSGSPVVCSPLWQAPLGNGAPGGVSVANGKVYTLDASGPMGSTMLYVFDAKGSSNCTGTPAVCTPLWTASVPGTLGSVSVSGSVAYVTTGSTVIAFDANGTSCSGSPKVCTPLWQYPTAEPVSGPAVISGTTLYVDTYNMVWVKPNPPVITGGLEAFDANGSSSCSGTPKTCAPLWQSGTYPATQSPTIANGVAFVPAWNTGSTVAFDANGSSNCSGVPKTCSPLWTDSDSTLPEGSVVVGGSVLYAAYGNHIDAFDAKGVAGCSAGVCSPLWTANPGLVDTVSIANGTLYAAGSSTNFTSAAVFAYGL